MAKERKTTNFFEILKQGAIQKQASEDSKSGTEASPTGVIVPPAAPAIPAKPVSVPTPPPVVPVAVSRSVPVVPEPPRAVPSAPAVVPGPVPSEPTLQMSYTTVLFLFLIFSAVPFVTYTLGRESGTPAAIRSRSSTSEKAAPKREERTSSTSSPSTPARHRYTLRLFAFPAGSASEAREAGTAATMLEQILQGRGLKEYKEVRQGNYLYVVYGAYPDSNGSLIRSDLEKLREVFFRGRKLNPTPHDLTR